MSEYAYCPKGGEDGILVQKWELRDFSKFLGTKFLDEYIPIPNITHEEQQKRIALANPGEQMYWETNEGTHGWCDGNTGRVTQWG